MILIINPHKVYEIQIAAYGRINNFPKDNEIVFLPNFKLTDEIIYCNTSL